jgi:hypothetical protein
MFSIRLFLSSTFLDFIWERRVVNNELVPALKHELRELGVYFDAVDLRWGVTQASGIDQSTVSICLDEVHRCCTDGAQPAFMLMVGDRSGWCPLPRLLPEDVFQTVHAQLATLGQQTANLFALWYLTDDNFLSPTRQLRERWGLAESSAAWSAVEQQLRQAVLQRAAHLTPAIVALFDTPVTEMEVDLALQFEAEFPGRSVALRRLPAAPLTDAVQQRLDALWGRVQGRIGVRAQVCQNQGGSAAEPDADYQAFFRTWFRDTILREVAAARATQEQRGTGTAGDLPFLETAFAHSPVPVVARQIEQQVLAWVQQPGAGGPGRPLGDWVRLLYGRSGSGKSSVVRRLHAAQPVALAAVMLGNSKTRLGPELTLADLQRWLRSGVWALAPGGQHGLRSVDALDAVGWNDASEALSWIPLAAPEQGRGMRLLLTTANDAIREAFASLFGEAAVWTLDEMTDDEAVQALQSDLAGVGRRLQDFQQQALVEATRAADGRALLTRIAARIARSLHASAQPQPPGPQASAWLRLWRSQLIDQLRYGAPMVDAVLAAACVARSPVPERILFELLSTDDQALAWLATAFPEQTSSLPRVLFARLLADIGGVLDREMHDGEWALRFSHALVVEALRGALAPAVLERARQRLADHAMEQFQSGRTVGPWEHNEVSQLLATCQPPRLQEMEYLLAQAPFLTRKCSPSLIASTLSDMSLLRQQTYLGSAVVEDAVGLVRKRWANLVELGSDTERLEWVWQSLRELPPSSALRKQAMLAATPEFGLAVRMPTASLPGLTWLNVDCRYNATAVLAGTDLVLEMYDGSLAVLDSEFGRVKRRLPGHGGKLSGALALPGNRLLSCGGDGEAALSSISAGRDIVRGKTGGGALEQSAATPDGGMVATCWASKTIYRWDAQGRLVGQMQAQEQQVPCCVLREDRLEMRTRSQAIADFFPDKRSMEEISTMFATDLLMLDEDRVLLLCMQGVVIWSFSQGKPMLVIDQKSEGSFAPTQVLVCQTTPTLCILLLTRAGGVFRLDLDTATWELLQAAGILPESSPRGHFGGVTVVSEELVFCWALRSEQQIDAMLIERASGHVIRTVQVVADNLDQSDFFRGSLSSVQRGLFLFEENRLLAWSASGLEIVDMERGLITPVLRWGIERYTTFAHLVGHEHVLLKQGGKIILLDFIHKKLQADFSDWTGPISTIRAMGAGSLLISDKEGHVALWNLPESLAARRDLDRWSNLTAQPMGVRRALLMDEDRLAVHARTWDDSAREFRLWQVDQQGLVYLSHGKSHSVIGTDKSAHLEPSGWLVEGNLLISWGRDGYIRYTCAEGDVLARLTFDGMGGIDHCIVLSGEEDDPEALPELLVSARNRLFMVRPGQRIAIPVPFQPQAGEVFLRAWSTACGVRILTSANLMELVFSPVNGPTLTHCLGVTALYGERARFNAASAMLDLEEPCVLAWLGVEITADGTDLFGAQNIASRHAFGLVFDAAFNLQAAGSWPNASLVWAIEETLLLSGADGRHFTLFATAAQSQGAQLADAGFIQQEACALHVHPRLAPQGRQTFTPDPALALTMDGPLPQSTLRLLEDRIVYTWPDGRATWYAPEGYTLMDATDDCRRLLVGLSDGTAQVIEVASALTAPPCASITSTVRNARWMVQLGGATQSVQLLSRIWASASPGFAQARCAIALCEALLMAGDLEQGSSLLNSIQFSSTEDDLRPDDVQNRSLHRQHRELVYRHALLVLPGLQELKDFLVPLAEGSDEKVLRQLQSLLKVATHMAVTGAPWLEKLKMVTGFFSYVLQDQTTVLYQALALPFTAYAYTLVRVFESGAGVQATTTLTRADWHQLLPEALQPVLDKALAGNGEASNTLGVRFALGDAGVNRSLPFARLWYLKGASQGNMMAAMNAAHMLRRGQGGAVDLHQCTVLLETCAKSGNRDAACNLGSMLLGLDGDDVPADYEQAHYWLVQALNAGDEIAAINLAVIYAMGLGVDKNFPKALELLGPLLSRGDANAQNVLGIIKAQEKK